MATVRIDIRDKLRAYLKKIYENIDNIEIDTSITLLGNIRGLWRLKFDIMNLQDEVSTLHGLLERVLELIGELSRINPDFQTLVKDIENFKKNLNERLIQLRDYYKQSYEPILRQYSKPDILMNLINQNEIKSLRKIINILCELTLDINSICSKIFFKINKTKPEIKTILNLISDRSRRETLEESFSSLTEKLEDLKNYIKRLYISIDEKSSPINQALDKLMSLSSHVSLEILYILWDLLLEINTKFGLWSWRLIDVITGLERITGASVTKMVVFRDELLEEHKLRLDEFLYQYPPFEPIARRNRQFRNIDVYGSTIWFIDSENVSVEDSRLRGRLFVKPNVFGEINNIELIDLTRLRTPIIMEIKLYKNRPLWIKYGSSKLIEHIRKIPKGLPKSKAEELIQSAYEKELFDKLKGMQAKAQSDRLRRAYRALDMAYVWFCRLGFGMSTDPWDFALCPFQLSKCPIGRKFSSSRCPLWSWRRQVFPKVLAVKRQQYYGKLEISDNFLLPFIKEIHAKNVSVEINYCTFFWRMPADIGHGMPVFIRLRRPIVLNLPQTNLIGFLMPYEVLKALIIELLDPDVPKRSCEFLFSDGSKYSLSLNYIILSKYFLWSESRKGYRLYPLLEKDIDDLKKNYKKLVKNVHEVLKKGTYNDIIDNVVDFAIEVLAHSFAHLLYSYLKERLDLEDRDLLYIIDINKRENYVMVAVAENSPFGTINILEHVKNKFGSIANMLIQFFRYSYNYLANIHKNIVGTYIYNKAQARNRFCKMEKDLSQVLYEIESIYKSLLSADFFIDISLFSLNLLLSGKYQKILDELNISKTRAFREFDTIISLMGPQLCMDGCSSCLMLERTCNKSFVQNLLVSRNLIEWFLSILLGHQYILGRAGRIGYVLFAKLPSKEFVAITPFVDEKGIKLLNTLSNKNVKVSLITRPQTIDTVKDKLQSVTVYELKIKSHYKKYVIDNSIIINTSSNLTLDSKSIESFKIDIFNENEKHIIKQIMENSRRVK